MFLLVRGHPGRTMSGPALDIHTRPLAGYSEIQGFHGRQMKNRNAQTHTHGSSRSCPCDSGWHTSPSHLFANPQKFSSETLSERLITSLRDPWFFPTFYSDVDSQYAVCVKR